MASRRDIALISSLEVERGHRLLTCLEHTMFLRAA